MITAIFIDRLSAQISALPFDNGLAISAFVEACTRLAVAHPCLAFTVPDGQLSQKAIDGLPFGPLHVVIADSWKEWVSSGRVPSMLNISIERRAQFERMREAISTGKLVLTRPPAGFFYDGDPQQVKKHHLGHIDKCIAYHTRCIETATRDIESVLSCANQSENIHYIYEYIIAHTERSNKKEQERAERLRIKRNSGGGVKRRKPPTVSK